MKLNRFMTAPATMALSLLFSAGAARASEMLFVTEFTGGNIQTYSFAMDGSGNVVDSSFAVFSGGGNGAWLANGPTGAMVPRIAESDGFGRLTTFDSTGAALPYVQPILLQSQTQMAEDCSGNVYTRRYNTGNKLYRIAPDQTATEFFTGSLGSGLAINAAGNMFITAGDNSVHQLSASGADLGQFADHVSGNPYELAFDSQGDLFELLGTSILKFSPSGSYVGVFASNIPNTLGGGRNQDPNTFTIDSHDNIYVAQGFGSIFRFTPDGTRSTIATPSDFQAFSIAALDVTPTGVPEPSTWMLVLTGVGAIAFGRSKNASRT